MGAVGGEDRYVARWGSGALREAAWVEEVYQGITLLWLVVGRVLDLAGEIGFL